MGNEIETNYSEKINFISPDIFQHIDLIINFTGAKAIDQKKLINLINYLNFSGVPLDILLKHPVFQNYLRIPAYPQPCFGDQLKCHWSESFHQYQLESYRPICLFIACQSNIIVVPLNVLESDLTTFTTQLPKKSYALNKRKYQRYTSRDVSVEVIQGELRLTGKLIDFSASAFRIRLDPNLLLNNSWFNSEIPVSVRLYSDDKIIYANSCRCIRYNNVAKLSMEIVFASENQHFSRFPSKKIRNPRHQITPSLMVLFDHPLTKKKIQRDIFDISLSGFSTYDKPLSEIFFPGMVIPHLSIQLAGVAIADCVVQIIYRRIEDQNVKFGFAILDMDIHSFSRINHLLSIDSNPRLSISTVVDMEALWDFFFKSGFIYPEKYEFCHKHRDKFIETFQTLYEQNPEIARHITYQQNGQIYGHISMVRAYERTWLIQHHAAISLDNKVTGFEVLRQIMLFANGMYQLTSAQMDYSICYFRPENKFPNRIFGGFAREFKNLKACSLDLFNYCTVPFTHNEKDLPGKWILRKSTPSDLWALEQFYEYNSGGLFMNILQLGKSDFGDVTIDKAFEYHGLLRKYSIYSLCYQNQLNAFFLVDQSDISINLSNLLNSIKVIIANPSGLTSEVLTIAIAKLGHVYNLDKLTLLIYPASILKSAVFSAEKQYQLWILNMNYMNQFMEYVQKNFRIKYK